MYDLLFPIYGYQMKSTKFVSIVFFSFSIIGFAQNKTWSECQYETNPSQCMQGVPLYQQTPPPMNFQPGITQGKKIELQGVPNFKSAPIPPPATLNCVPNGFGGYTCSK
jgi:hypothetical protein